MSEYPLRTERVFCCCRPGAQALLCQKSALYRYEYGPAFERLDYDGLRRLQRAILDLLRDAWALLRGDLLRRFVGELRWRLGL